jgi:hypothetical protein
LSILATHYIVDNVRAWLLPVGLTRGQNIHFAPVPPTGAEFFAWRKCKGLKPLETVKKPSYFAVWQALLGWLATVAAK